MDISALEMISPVDQSNASSRSGSSGLICLARASKSSVVSPIAETTTTTRVPDSWTAETRLATLLMRSAEATEDPPYFWTMRFATLSDGNSDPRVHCPGTQDTRGQGEATHAAAAVQGDHADRGAGRVHCAGRNGDRRRDDWRGKQRLVQRGAAR